METNIGEMLESSMGTGEQNGGTQEQSEQVEAEQAQTPQVEEKDNQEIERPSFDPDALFAPIKDQMAQVNTQVSEMYQAQQEANKPAPTEDELLAKEMQERLGVSKQQQEIAELKEMLKKQQEFQEQQAEMVRVNNERAEIAELHSQFEFKDEEVVSKLKELAETVSPEFARSLNNKNGWKHVIQTYMGGSQAKEQAPDSNIIQEQTSDFNAVDSAVNRVNSGNVSKGDVGNLLMSYLD